MLTKLINKIGLDKCAHFGIGGLICALFTIFCYIATASLTTFQILIFPFIGTVITFIISLIKEYVFDKGREDWNDIWAAMIGCGFVYVTILVGLIF